MAVDKLCREAFRIGRHGVNTAFVYFPGACGRKLYLKAQRLKEGIPEGKTLPKRENSGDPDNCILFGKKLFVGIIPALKSLSKFKEIGGLALALFKLLYFLNSLFILKITGDLSLFTAVVRYPAFPGGEGQNGTLAVVSAVRAFGRSFSSVGKAFQLFGRKKGLFEILLGSALFCRQRRTDSPHEPGIGRTDNVPSDILLHRPEHSVIFEGAALNNDIFSERLDIGNADNLCEYIFHYGAAKPRHDVVGIFAVTLLGYYAAVHKYSAAAAELGGILRVKGALSYISGFYMKCFCEIFQERAAPCGTGLINDDVGNNAVFHPYCFHILSADVEDKAGIFYIFGRSQGMSHRFDHMRLGLKGF